jgi:transposase
LDNERSQARIKELEAQVLLLSQQLDYLKRQLFGRKSEGFDHPDLFSPGAPGEPGKAASSGDADAPEDESQTAPVTGKEPKRRRKIRKDRLPDNVPVITEEIVPAFVQADPDAWRPAGHEESWQLEKEPGYFYLRHIKRLKFVRRDEPFSPPVIEPAKPSLIDGGFWGSGLLAEILATDAADKVADQLGILVSRMKDGMLAGGLVRADETFIRYLDRLDPGGSSRGYFWVYRGLDGDVIFDWQTSREHRHAAEWLGPDFEGILQSDGYQAYDQYCELQNLRGKKVRRAACLAHIRRKFEAAKDERPEVVRWILKIIAQLYRIETPMREHGASAEVRARVRHNRGRPLVRLLEKAFHHLRTTAIRPKSRLGEALNYALGQWSAMGTFLDDGRVELDNNDTENDIRPSAVGKKNWLFIGHPEAGRRGAVLYTLLISARNHGVDPQAYLKDVIERLPGTRTDDLDALLPSNWAAAHRKTRPLAKPLRSDAA